MESEFSITSLKALNLDLAAALTGYELANYGVSLTWSSSNTDRITNAGVVDNTNVLDENVTMTATVRNESDFSIELAKKFIHRKTPTNFQRYTGLSFINRSEVHKLFL